MCWGCVFPRDSDFIQLMLSWFYTIWREKSWVRSFTMKLLQKSTSTNFLHGIFQVCCISFPFHFYYLFVSYCGSLFNIAVHFNKLVHLWTISVMKCYNTSIIYFTMPVWMQLSCWKINLCILNSFPYILSFQFPSGILLSANKCCLIWFAIRLSDDILALIHLGCDTFALGSEICLALFIFPLHSVFHMFLCPLYR